MPNKLTASFVALLTISTFAGFSQNIKVVDSLIGLYNNTSIKNETRKQSLLQDIIFEVVEYDSLASEKYLQEYYNVYSNKSPLQKIFYYKNRGVFYTNCYNNNKALTELKKAMEIAQASAFEKELADIYNNIANVYSNLYDDKKSLEFYEKAIALYKKNKQEDDEAAIYSNMANLYGGKGKFNDAIPYALKALRIREKINNQAGVAHTSLNLAIMYKNIGRYNDALKSLEVAQKFYTASKDEKSLMRVFLVKGSTYRSMELYDRARATFLEIIPVLEKYNYTAALINTYENLGQITASQSKDYKAAYEYYQKAETYYTKINSLQGRISSNINMAQSAFDLKNFTLSEQKINEAEKLARENNFKVELFEALKLKMNLSINKGEKENAVDKLTELLKLREDIINENLNKNIDEIKIQYETEKKEAAIKLLNSENALQKQTLARNQLRLLNNELELDKQSLVLGNQNLLIDNQQLELKNNQSALAKNNLELKNKQQKINILNLNDKNKSLEIQKKNRQLLFGVIAFLLLALAAYLLYNRYRLRQKNKLQTAIIKEQDEAAKAVVSAEEHERSRMSQTLHDGLGQLLSAAKMNLQAVQENLQLNPQMTTAYNNALMLVDDSIKEMRSVSHQMVTNNVVRTGLANALKELIEKIDTNRLKVNLNVDGLLHNIETDIQVVVYRIIQESINNVIKHARADTLNIDLKIANTNLTGRITDNGIGFDTSKAGKRAGIGLDNIATRIKFLKGTHHVKSSAGSGTELSFKIPLQR